MRRQVAMILTCLCCVASMYAKKHKEPLINYGAKTGFSSTIYEVNKLQVSGMPINEYISKSEISSFYTLFARINIKQSHYLQTEASYNISNYTIAFPTQQWKPTAPLQETSSISTKIIGFEIPLFYGYHVLKEGPYGMSFYAGPKAKFTLTNQSNHQFENLTYTSITESIRPINFSLMVGMGVNIQRVFFDFSFEYGLHNISKGFVTTNEYGDAHSEDFVFDRRKNVLSFSVGFMF